MTGETIASSTRILFSCIQEAYKKGFDVDNPDNQASPTIRNGVRRLREGKRLTLEDITKIEKMGGTDHPDPWIG